MKLLELWSGDVKTKKHPPEGLFSKGSATEIAAWLKKTHDDLKGAMGALTFYRNRAGKNLSDGQKAKLDHVKALLHAKEEKKKDEKEVKEQLELNEALTPQLTEILTKLIALRNKSKTIKSGDQPIDAEEWKFSEIANTELDVSSQVSHLITKTQLAARLVRAVKQNITTVDRLNKLLAGKDSEFEKNCKERDA